MSFLGHMWEKVSPKLYEPIWRENVITRIVLFEKWKPRPKVSWHSELYQDLMAFHHIDAEAELTALLSAEISKEINKEIIGKLVDLVDERHTFTKTIFVEKIKL